MSARLKRDTGGPQNAQLMLRKASTDYPGSNLANVGVGFDGHVNIWETDPNTAAAWTIADANAATLEFGVKATT